MSTTALLICRSIGRLICLNVGLPFTDYTTPRRPATTRVAAVAPPESHNLIHDMHLLD